jgi:ParB family chromosome partitioning protein
MLSTVFNFQKTNPKGKVTNIPINQIVRNHYQPRTEFEYSDLSSLTESIRENGILQPLTVRRLEHGYELIAGERRLRAAQMASVQEVPCIVLDITERSSAILALVENIQRQELSFFDEAKAIENLISCYGLTQEDAAIKLGKAQSTIANKLRLLKLSNKTDRLEIIRRIIKYRLNVECTEQAIEEYIKQNNLRESYRKRRKAFKDARIFINSINKTIDTMKATGMSVEADKTQTEEYVEYRVRIPLTKASV